MKQKFLDYYMAIAQQTASLSTARRLQVGSVIVKNHKILATGYNGTPSGWDNSCEEIEWCSAGGWLSPQEIEEDWPYEGTYIDDAGNEVRGRYRLVTKDIVLHSEMNALTKVARSTESSDDSIMFCTHAPCLECAKAIYQSGVKKLYWRDQYRSEDGLRFLEKSGVEVAQHGTV